MLIHITLASLAALSAVSSGMQSSESASYQLKHVPAKVVVSQVAKMYAAESEDGTSFSAGEFKVWTDIERNRIYWDDPKQELDSVIALFDVPRLPLKVSLVVYSPFFDKTWTSESTLYNGQVFSYEDTDYGVKIELTPRVTEDGMVSVLTNSSGEMVFLRNNVTSAKSVDVKYVSYRLQPESGTSLETLQSKLRAHVDGLKEDVFLPKATDLYYSFKVELLNK